MQTIKINRAQLTKLDEKGQIIKIFLEKVYNKSPETSGQNPKHSGKKGHWLEAQMGLSANSKNDADILGYEMKNHTTSKTTFGDWSADYFPFKRNAKQKFPTRKANQFREISLSRIDFMKFFGSDREDHQRLSWSGKSIPKINTTSHAGTRFDVDDQGNISIIYNYNQDKRISRHSVPIPLRSGDILIAHWPASWMRKKVENKFNQKGWFKCNMVNGVYSSITFGSPINFENWLNLFKSGEVFFDPGMYEGNPRNYCQWRASNKIWEELASETYIV